MGSPARGHGSNCKLYVYERPVPVRIQQRDLQGVLQVFVYLHDGGLVAAAIAVVRGWTCQTNSSQQGIKISFTRKDRDDVTVLRPIVTLHNKLVRPCHQRQSVVMIERLRNILPEGVPSASGRYSPATPVIWIRPQEIAHGPFVRNLLYPIEGSDVVERVNAR